MYLHTYLPTYLYTYLFNHYLYIYLPTYWLYLFAHYLRIYLPTYQLTNWPTYLPLHIYLTYLPCYQPHYPPTALITHLPNNLTTRQKKPHPLTNLCLSRASSVRGAIKQETLQWAERKSNFAFCACGLESAEVKRIRFRMACPHHYS